MSRALVTGGAGFIGSHLVDALLESGYEVRVVDNLDEQAHEGGRPRFLSTQAELIVGDFRDRAVVAAALEGVELVFHQGGYVDVNVGGTAVLLEEVLRRRDTVGRVIAASSMVVYGEGAYRCAEHGAISPGLRDAADLAAHRWEPRCPVCGGALEPAPTGEAEPLRATSPYGISKQAAEELVLTTGHAHGIETVALRYLNVYGPRQALSNPYTGVAAIFCTRLLRGRRPLLFEDGRQQRDLIHVSDVVRANLAAIDAPVAGLAVNVGTGSSMTVAAIATALARRLNPSLEPELTGQYRAGDIRHCWADVSRARDLLGFEATVDRGEALGELADWVATEAPTDRTEAATAELIRRGLIR